MKLKARLLVGLMAWSVATAANAEIVTLEFSARLDDVSSLARSIFTIGDLATIRYSFEATAPPSSTPYGAAYLSIRSLEFTIQLATGVDGLDGVRCWHIDSRPAPSAV